MEVAACKRILLLFAAIAVLTSVCCGDLTNGVRCVGKRNQIDFCNSFPFQHSAVPNLGGGFVQDDIEQELRSFSLLYRLGCSNALVHFLCSYYKPPCFIMDGATISLPPCQELCVYVRSTCEPMLNLHNHVWPDHFDCSRFPSSCGSGLCFPGYDTLDKYKLLSSLPVPHVFSPFQVHKGSQFRLRGGQSVGFSNTEYRVEEGAAAAVTLEVDCTPDCAFIVILEVSLSGADTSDFKVGHYSTVFPVGVKSTSVVVEATDDIIAEKTEAFSLRIAAVNSTCGVRIGAISSTTIYIEDNETIEVSMDSAAYSVNEGGKVNVTLRTNSSLYSFPFSVSLMFMDLTASQGSDYVPQPTTVSFSAGENQVSVEVATVDDEVAELKEMFKIVILNVTSAGSTSCVVVGSDDTAEVEIVDNDVITTCSKAFCKRRSGDTMCQVPARTAGAVSGCTGPVDLTTCKACYYSREVRSPPRACRVKCQGQLSEQCIRNYGRCVRRRNNRRFKKVSKALRKQANFKCYRPIC